MSIDVELYRKIRFMYINEKRSIRAIARELKKCRKTVRKYCEGGVRYDLNKIPIRDNSFRQEVEKEILALLEENKELPKKQRRNAKDIWEYLLNEKNIPLSSATIRRYVYELKKKYPEVYIPLDHAPGESIQFDWGDNVAVIGNTKTVVSTFCAAFPNSSAIIGFVYPNKKMLSFLDGHIQTFNFFDGVPKKCVFDNLKTAVLEGSGQNAVKQSEFKRLEAHYGFESVFCNVASGNEKSAVENAVAIVRNIAFKPIPHVDSYDELQKHVTNKCLDYIKTHTIRGKENSIEQMLKIEQEHLMPLPLMSLDPGNSISALVHSDLTVLHEGTKYSVPKVLAGKQVTLVVTPFHIKIFYQGREMWKHLKSFKKYQNQYVLEHYLEILEQKPRAIEQAKPLSDKGIMPKECSEFLRLCREENRKHQLVEILLLGRMIPQEKVLWAIEQANNTHSPSSKLVKFFLDLEEENTITDSIQIEHRPLDIYDSFLGDEI